MLCSSPSPLLFCFLLSSPLPAVQIHWGITINPPTIHFNKTPTGSLNNSLPPLAFTLIQTRNDWLSFTSDLITRWHPAISLSLSPLSYLFSHSLFSLSLSFPTCCLTLCFLSLSLVSRCRLTVLEAVYCSIRRNRRGILTSCRAGRSFVKANWRYASLPPSR